jgi:phosphoglycerate dehydrogenase-like enzyme
MNILFLFTLDERWKQKYEDLKKEFPQVNFFNVTDPDKRAEALKDCDAVVSGRISAEEIESAKNLKVIFVPFTGLNSFLLELIKTKKIILSNTHANAPYVAERAVTLALSLLGRVVEFHNDLAKGKWGRSDDNDDMWLSLRGKTCGILGLGNIGLNISKLLKPYDCKIIGFKKNVSTISADFTGEISADLDYVLDISEVIFSVLPLNPETKHLLNAQNLPKMKGKFIINVGRGETIHEESLYNALKDGTLAGAALDVWV